MKSSRKSNTVRVASFLTGQTTENRLKLVNEWSTIKEYETMQLLKSSLTTKLDRLVRDDEKSSFSTWFQTRWTKAGNLAKRELLRDLLKDLT